MTHKRWLYIFVLALFLAVGRVDADPLSPSALDADFDRLALSLATPDKLSSLLNRKFSLRSDEELMGKLDYWQSAEEFWKRKAGDCEDFAVFAQRILEAQGIASWIVSIYAPGDGYAHTVLVFREGNFYHVFNEGRLIRCRAGSIEESISYVYPAWKWAAIAVRKDSRGRLQRLLRNA